MRRWRAGSDWGPGLGLAGRWALGRYVKVSRGWRPWESGLVAVGLGCLASNRWRGRSKQAKDETRG